MRYYISDLHFYHEALLREMDQRGFENIESMHEHVVKVWNERVNKRDEVILLGDVSYGSAEETNRILSRLNGKLFLIRGNHDLRFLKKSDFHIERFGWVKDYHEMNDGGKKVILSHYPMLFYNGQYRTDSKGEPKTFMLYGHVHDSHDQKLVEEFAKKMRNTEVVTAKGETRKLQCNLINCFCMYSGYVPLSLEEWITYWRNR